jgi:hypothetical protein
VSRSEHIAVVDVASVSSAWDRNHEQIVSTIELSVVERWKGDGAPTHYTVMQLGGTVGDLTMVVHGMSQFTVGERALVFLRGTPERAAVVGMAQGKRAIRRDADTGAWLVHAPDRAGAVFMRTTPPGAASPVFDMRARPLEALRDEVRTLAAQPSKAQ